MAQSPVSFRLSISLKLPCSYRAGYDVYHEPDQSKVAVDLVHGLLNSATGKDGDGNPLLLPNDLSLYSGKRRADARATNPQYTTSLAHRMFGSSK